MAEKTDFTPEEWKTLLESVMMAGIAVTAADPSGLWGTLKESLASAHSVVSTKYDPNATELIKALAAEFETGEGRATARDGLRSQLSSRTPPEIVSKSLEVLKDAASIVTVKSPSEAGAFKGWLQHISQSVAEASTEGGFLGFGGVTVSEAEKATLAQISSSLGLAA
ncbi:MAG: hypothetical protein FWD08_03770 [Alphaproteobacteria bacterium]|nr:hypothetical protein [Alphaproteobacteria bacterium]MCL2452756.1 hypothetical protein [Alphaproteobacteria bacterium]